MTHISTAPQDRQPSVRRAQRREALCRQLPPKPKRELLMPSAEENAKIVAAAKADLDAKPLTKKQLQAMMPLKAGRARNVRHTR
jgi:hypothetical protein